MRTYGIAIVGASRHHTKSLLALAVSLRKEDTRNTAFVISAGEDFQYFTELAKQYGTDVVSIDRGESHPCSLTGHKRSSVKGALLKRVADYVRNVAVSDDSSKRNSFWSAFLKKVLVRLYESSAGQLLRERLIVKRIESYKQKAGEILDRTQARAIFTLGDRNPGIEGAILWAARKRKLRIILPYVSSFAIEGAVAVRRLPNGDAVRGHGAFYPFSLYRLFSYYKFRAQIYDGLFYQPPAMLNAAKKCSVASDFPWTNGHGLSDVICVDSEHTAQIYKSCGIPEEKIKVVGGFSYDTLYESYGNRAAIKQRLYRTFAFEPEKKLIVVALPQYAEQGLLSSDEHWSQVLRIVRFVKDSKQNIILALHPRHDRKKYAFLAGKFDCRIADEPLEKYLPACDLFLASHSSTLVWATLCQIPAVNFDFVGLNFTLYDYMKSIQKVHEFSELVPAIRKRLEGSSIDFTSDWRALSRDDVFDGRTIARYASLLEG